MTSTKRSLAMAVALSFGVLGVACSSDGSDNNNGGTGGSSSSGGSGGSAGGRGGSTGGSTSSGGSTGGSSSSGGSGGSTGGSGGSGGSTGGSGGSGGSTGGSGGSTGGSSDGGKSDGGKSDGSGGAEAGGTGAFTITIDNAGMMGDRICFKSEASASGGNKSPKIEWPEPPAGTKSFVLSMEDLSNTTPHQIITDIPPTVRMNPPDAKAMRPTGSSACYGHNQSAWYGPGAGGQAHRYEITIWALAVEKLPQACMGAGNGGTAKAVINFLKGKKSDPTVVLASDSKILWGNREGMCRP